MITSLRDEFSFTPRSRFSRGTARGGMACTGHWRPRALLRADLAGVWLSVFASVTAAASGEVELPADVCGYELTVAVLDPCCGCFGSPNNWGRGVNALGHVVGRYSACDDTTEYAFLWTGGPEIITLDLPWDGSSQAFDINDSGQITGTIDEGVGRRAFFFDGEEFQQIPVPAGGTYTEGAAINESGRITGSWGNNVTGDPTGEEAFLWEDGVMTPLGPILGTPKSSGDDINDHGWITGWMGESLSSSHAFRWDGQQVVDLGLPPGAIRSAGTSINNNGDVAGFVNFKDPRTGDVVVNAALWIDLAFIDLGRLPGHEKCRARGINDRGEVVGHCETIGLPVTAFLWRDGMMFELDSLVKGEHETLKLAWAINYNGAVTGATSPNDTFLVVPVDGPLADLTGDCAVNADDLLVLLAQWGGPGAADFDGDGIVGLTDLLALLLGWS